MASGGKLSTSFGNGCEGYTYSLVEVATIARQKNGPEDTVQLTAATEAIYPSRASYFSARDDVYGPRTAEIQLAV